MNEPITVDPTMPILNIAGYQFIALNDLNHLDQKLRDSCLALGLKGTILLSEEGINLNLAGDTSAIVQFQTILRQDPRFTAMTFHESYSATIPFKRFKVKHKKEIITFRQKDATPLNQRAGTISPALLKTWLDEKRDFTLLDTRNDYEIELGTFQNAAQLAINDFCELPQKLSSLEKEKPLVMFCTGGIRCEKAALHMKQQGFSEVYQLDGGILGYFNQVGGDHYDGACFVFDERVALDAKLNPIEQTIA